MFQERRYLTHRNEIDRYSSLLTKADEQKAVIFSLNKSIPNIPESEDDAELNKMLTEEREIIYERNCSLEKSIDEHRFMCIR